MRHWMPILMAVVSVVFFGMAWFLRQGAEGTHTAITNLTSSFMFFAACICLVVGIVTYCMRNDETVW
jgi:hypothetical protein